MKRAITGFRRDAEGDWVAVLDCHHGQHVRHRPPMSERPWTLTADGRERMLGATLECVRCDRFEWPEGLSEYKRTRVFTEGTVPKGLLADHTTRTGVWGRLHVEAGAVRYIAGEHDEVVTAGRSAAIVPSMPHRVEPVGEARFYVAFHRPR